MDARQELEARRILISLDHLKPGHDKNRQKLNRFLRAFKASLACSDCNILQGATIRLTGSSSEGTAVSASSDFDLLLILPEPYRAVNFQILQGPEPGFYKLRWIKELKDKNNIEEVLSKGVTGEEVNQASVVFNHFKEPNPSEVEKVIQATIENQHGIKNEFSLPDKTPLASMQSVGVMPSHCLTETANSSSIIISRDTPISSTINEEIFPAGPSLTKEYYAGTSVAVEVQADDDKLVSGFQNYFIKKFLFLKKLFSCINNKDEIIIVESVAVDRDCNASDSIVANKPAGNYDVGLVTSESAPVIEPSSQVIPIKTINSLTNDAHQPITHNFANSNEKFASISATTNHIYYLDDKNTDTLLPKNSVNNFDSHKTPISPLHINKIPIHPFDNHKIPFLPRISMKEKDVDSNTLFDSSQISKTNNIDTKYFISEKIVRKRPKFVNGDGFLKVSQLKEYLFDKLQDIIYSMKEKSYGWSMSCRGQVSTFVVMFNSPGNPIKIDIVPQLEAETWNDCPDKHCDLPPSLACLANTDCPMYFTLATAGHLQRTCFDAPLLASVAFSLLENKAMQASPNVCGAVCLAKLASLSHNWKKNYGLRGFQIKRIAIKHFDELDQLNTWQGFLKLLLYLSQELKFGAIDGYFILNQDIFFRNETKCLELSNLLRKASQTLTPSSLRITDGQARNTRFHMLY